MPERRGDDWTISIEEWPSPVCRYESTDRGPVVRGVNSAFEATFGSRVVGERLTNAFRALDLSIDASEDVESWLARDDPEPIRGTRPTDDGRAPARYLLQATAEARDVGHLVLTPLPAAHAPPANADGVDLGHVASVISHDLRNPLDVAKARLRAGRERADDEHFEHVARAHDRMERIVEDVLTLAGGRDAVDRAPAVDLEPLVEAAWDAVDTGDARLVVDRPLPTVAADRDRTARLFENLFRNAVEHGPASPGSQARQDAVERGSTNLDSSAVTVTVGSLDRDDGAGVFVADDGCGIPADRRERVFDLGYSSDDGGTGLGLAIVERIATLHGWSIAVEVSEDGGARFELRDLEGTADEDHRS